MMSGLQQKRPIRTMTRLGRGGKHGRKQLATDRENLLELVGWNDLELFKGAVARALVVTPPAKLGRVAKAAALHVIVRHFDDELRAKRLPR